MLLKYLTFCALIIGIFSASNLFGQCEKGPIDAKYQVVKSLEGLAEVTFTLPADIKAKRVQLYDLNDGLIKDEQVVSARREISFKKVSPSLYAFYVWIEDCSVPKVYSGDKSGILIEN